MAQMAKVLAGSVGLALLSAICGASPARDPGALATALNEAYYGYRGEDPWSPLGVTMHWPSHSRSFYANIFCDSVDNPRGRTGCSQGRNDCRFSAALYNHRMIITEGHTLMDTMRRRTAIIINQTLIEQHIGRCFFAWDGATNNKFNVGCGRGASSDCAAPGSAYQNVCPSTGRLCTARDRESKAGLCAQYGGDAPAPQSHSRGFQCAFPGPALDYHGQADWQPAETRHVLRQMVDFRIANQDGLDENEGILKIKMWNEVVVDLRLMMPLIAADPALVVPAFAYWKGDDAAKADARAMRDEYCRVNGMSTKIPLIALDWRAVTLNREPVFQALPEDNYDAVVV